MKASPDCIPYALNQVLATARLVTEDEWIHRKVLMRALADLAEDNDLEKTASEIIFACLDIAYKSLGVKDPYENEKARITKAVGALLPGFTEKIKKSKDKNYAALLLAMAGSEIGAEVNDRHKIEKTVNNVLDIDPAIDNREDLLRQLKRADKVVYILNNAGESLCDKLFIEEISRKSKVTVVVRNSPILNDVTIDDAKNIGLFDIENVTVIEPGFPMLGILLEKSSSELKQVFEDADVIISKGQANYETLFADDLNIYFLFSARSKDICKNLDVAQGAQVILKQSANSKSGNASSVSGRIKIKN